MSVFEDSLAPRTRFDLAFRLGDIPVRVHPFFWLSTLFLGLDPNRQGVDLLIGLLIWAAVVFVSILVHELGHVLMGRWFGTRGHIVLTGFCGLAIGSNELPQRRQRIAVSLAGPGAGFLLAGLVAGASWLLYPAVTLFLLGRLIGVSAPIGLEDAIPPDLIMQTIYIVLWINVLWGLVNLLPIWPLDGGQVCREICQSYRGPDGVTLSLGISVGTAAGFAVLALVQWAPKTPLIPWLPFGGSLFAVLFFALLAASSWQLLQFVRRAGPDWEHGGQEPLEPWQQDADWWKRGDNSWRD